MHIHTSSGGHLTMLQPGKVEAIGGRLYGLMNAPGSLESQEEYGLLVELMKKGVLTVFDQYIVQGEYL